MTGFDRIRIRWPGLPGSTRCDRRVLSGGIAVCLRKDVWGWHWLCISPAGVVSGRADNRAAAQRAAVFAGEVR